MAADGVAVLVVVGDADGVAMVLAGAGAPAEAEAVANTAGTVLCGDAVGARRDGATEGTAVGEGVADARTIAELPKRSVPMANSTAMTTRPSAMATTPMRTSRPRNLRLRKFSYLFGLYRSLCNAASMYTTHSIAPAENLEKKVFFDRHRLRQGALAIIIILFKSLQ